MKIDAHHHFWQYNATEYVWINEGMRDLQRDFLPEHLSAELKAAGIDAAVSVQARQNLAETVWLLDLADEHEFIHGVVGWVPLSAPDVELILDRLASQKKLKGVRHVLQDEAPAFLLQPSFRNGVAALASRGLVYDLLIREQHLQTAIELVDESPKTHFVLDHIAKPRIQLGLREPWSGLMKELARRPNVFCKLSGVVTEADWNEWTEDSIRPYLDVALEAFGPSRLMFGSDWPVCLLATSYSRWLEVVEGATSSLSEGERERIFGETAREVYSL